MKLMTIALRNLTRHKIKTTLTIITIIVSVTLYIFMDAWLLGMKEDSFKNIVNFETGSVIIYSKNYFDKKDEIPTYEQFYNGDEIIKKLKENGYYATKRINFTGSLINNHIEIPFEFCGIDVENEKDVLFYYKYVKDGSFFENNNDLQFEILLGEQGAKKLGVNVGDSVILSTVIDKKDHNGKLKHIYQAITLKVKGIIFSPNPKTNGLIGYLPLNILQDEQGILLEGGINCIYVRKKDANPNILPLMNEENIKIQNILSGMSNIKDLKIINWYDDIKDFFGAYYGDYVSTNVMLFILFIISFLGIGNTMLMASLQRTKEIGMMKALGLTDFDVKKIFLFEAFWIGLIGTLIGIFFGILINFYMVNIGIDYTEALKSFGTDYGYRIVGHFKASWNFSTIVKILFITPLIAILISYFSVNKQTKIQITEALRFD